MQGITQVERQGVSLFGLHLPATVETVTLRAPKPYRRGLSQSWLRKQHA